MKEKIKKILIGTVIVIIGFIVISELLVVIPMRSEGMNSCKEECIYFPPRESSGGILKSDKGDYWNYKGRKFEAQDQCLDYCFSKFEEETGWKHFIWIIGFMRGFMKGIFTQTPE